MQDRPRNMIASGILRATEVGLLTLSYEAALKVADHVLETLDAWDCAVTARSPAGVWIVWELDHEDDTLIQGVAGVYDNAPAARECESATVDLPRGTKREAGRWHVQAAYTGERRMC